MKRKINKMSNRVCLFRTIKQLCYLGVDLCEENDINYIYEIESVFANIINLIEGNEC